MTAIRTFEDYARIAFERDRVRRHVIDLEDDGSLRVTTIDATDPPGLWRVVFLVQGERAGGTAPEPRAVTPIEERRWLRLLLVCCAFWILSALMLAWVIWRLTT